MSTYTGASAVNAGTLIVNGDIDTSVSLSVAEESTLEGEGSVPPVSISGTVKPGDGTSADIGILVAEAATLNEGGTLALDFGDVDGSAGVNWDLLNAATGVVTIASSSGSPFVIELHADNISGWDASQSYDFVIIQGASVGSFSADKFTVESSDWPAKNGGVFSVAEDSGDLVLHFEPAADVPAPTDCYVTNAGPECMSLMWTPPYATTDVLVVRRQGATPEAPVDGTAYTNYQRFGSGDETLVVYRGTNTSAQDMELLAETSYSYAMYAAYGSGASVDYSEAGSLKGGGVLTNTTTAFLDVGLPLESFAYFPCTATNSMDGGTNWLAGWGRAWGDFSVVEGSLAMPANALPAYGNKLRMEPPEVIPEEYGSGVYRYFDPMDSGTLYVQFALNMATNNEYRYSLLILCDTNSGEVLERIALGVPGKTNVLSVQRHWVDGPTANWATACSDIVVEPGVDYLCFAKFDFSQHKAWITGYPYTGVVPSQEPGELHWGTSMEFPSDWATNLNAVRISVGAYSNQSAGLVCFDEIRMGTTWTNFAAASETPVSWAVWDGDAYIYTSSCYSVDMNWENNARPTNGATLVFTGTQNLYPTNDYGTATQWESIWFTNTASSFTLGGDAGSVRTRIQNNSTAAQTVNQVITFNGNYTGWVSAVSGDLVLNQDVYLETNLTLFVCGGETVVINGALQDGEGSSTSSVTVVDGTLLIYSNANTYAGRTYIYDGELRLGADNVIYDSGNVEMTSNGILNLNGHHEKIGRLSTSGGEVQLGSGTLQIQGNVAGSAINGEVSGSGSLVYVGFSNSLPLALTATNSYEGGTSVSGAWITVWTDRNLGAVPSSPTENIRIANNSAVRFTNSMTLHPNRTIKIEGTHLNTGGAIFVSPGMTLDYGGCIDGYGRLSLSGGGGVLNLKGSSTFTGVVEVKWGTLALDADLNLGPPPENVISNGINYGTSYGGDWQILRFTNSFTLNANRGILMRTNGNLNIEVDEGIAAVYDGKITEEHAGKELAKIGLGTLSLGGEQTFTGPLYHDAGTLILRGADPLDCSYLNLGRESGSDPAILNLGADGVVLDVPLIVRAGSSGVKQLVAGNSEGTVTLSAAGYVNLVDDLLVEADSGGSLLFAGDINMGASGNHDLSITGANDVILSARLVAPSRDSDLNVMAPFYPNGDNRTEVENQMKINISAGGVLTVDWANDFGDEPTSAYTDKVNFLGSGGTLNVTNDVNLTAVSGYQYGFTVAEGANAVLSVSGTRTFLVSGAISGAGDMSKTG
ncbi:MAG: hypothetical protein PHG65_10540, partial [Kiritimatiellae bacterium]|nr:hypothetical protein [Kiritimatiellia bacterium]